ncbi:glycoside hydrolase family 5 protein [Dothidotthia symphoricarpi CBS 119687]|uniref:Glycoside hydrolase family 5 protein n=1 Tax=Dothidotthia symphoricarpi CBS 119687 TaxID=1392245 RepID=A0A6A6AJ89_9PLEO|nr:glycoside hydrolase family 5 protein [Dothidotthia symphoricarpi CBS 119687]KAF2131870.1 glycoside hydrolase family 5 protein [Dothidotthia symphoricarpi CBS 119687]
MGSYFKAAVFGGALLNGGFAVAQASTKAAVTCPSTAKFNTISASKFYAGLNPGWNVGNTLDAIETEGSWNNPPVVDSTFNDVENAGFKSVRLPVTWAYHFKSQAPDYTVDPTWLQRVSDVVDMIDRRGLYTIVNVHHDSWSWADLTQSATNVTMVEDKLYKLWFQIGTKLACKGERVAFETINELPGTTAEHGAITNRLNNIFLQAINDAGGFNPQRVVTLVSSGEDGYKTTQWFEPPDAKFKNPWGIQYHYYSPYDFIFGAWGKTTWGSAAEKATLETDIAVVRGNFTGIPIVIGEWAASPVATETAARWRYFDFFIRTAAKYNTSTVLWDNGADFLDRAAHTWRDEVAMDIYRNAVKGIPNALPDSTTDGSATRQESSAYIYHAKNSSVAAVTLPFLFNGNTLRSISLARKRTLTKGTEYTVSGEKITFAASFLNTILTPTSQYGSLANLTLQFNQGADLQVNILQYGTPVLAQTSAKLPATSADLSIPITWRGQNRPAAVKAIKSDGSYLMDDFTQYFGPLQQGRITYGSWDWDASNVILKANVIDAVRSGGKDTTFTIEFYPREAGNSVDFVVKV